LAGKKVAPDIIQKAMFKMKPDEKDLFREGYASDWANRVIGNMSQTRDITKAMFNSPNERARAEAVFGRPEFARSKPHDAGNSHGRGTQGDGQLDDGAAAH